MTLARMQQRRDSTADWASVDPVLLDGELGYDTDEDRFKIGDGVTEWTGLPWADRLEDVLAAQAAAEAAQAAAEDARDDAEAIAGLPTADAANALLIEDKESATGRAILDDIGRLTTGPLGVLSEALERKVRILTCGTSIGSFANAPNRILGAVIRDRYGAAPTYSERMGAAGGSYTADYQGWKKQRYGGRHFHRLRGDSSASQDLTFYTPQPCDVVALEFSTEANGTTAVVQVDGVTVDTIDCSGAQTYGNRAEYAVTYGYHTVTIAKPATPGIYVYLEHLEYDTADAVGVAFIDDALGGSAVNQMRAGYAPAPDGAQAAAIATVGNNGIDATFNRDDFDVIVATWTVNDAGGGMGAFASYFTPLLDRAVETTRDNNTRVIYIIEPAGHYGHPSDTNNDAFYAIRDYLLALGAEHSHWTVIDWHAALWMGDSTDEFAAYRDAFYPTAVYNPGTGEVTGGDFIHPDNIGTRIGAQAVTARLGLEPPDTYDVPSKELDRANITVEGERLVPTGATITNQGLITVRDRPSGYLTSGGPVKVPYWVDNTVPITTGAADLQDTITAAVTTDEFGKYRDLGATTPTITVGRNVLAGERFTVVMLVRGLWTVVVVGATHNMWTADGIEVPTIAGNKRITGNTGSKPAYVSFQVQRPSLGNVCDLTLGDGDLYGFWATTADKPVVTSKRFRSLRSIGPDTYMTGDLALSALTPGQTYVEDFVALGLTGGGVARKRLIPGAWARKLFTAGDTIVGVYESLDRTASGILTVRARNLTGVTTAGAQFAGGSGDLSSNAGWDEYTAYLSPGAGVTGQRRTLLVRCPVASALNIKLENGGNNAQLWLTSAGTWSTVSSNITTSFPGDNLSLTFDAPPSDTLGHNGAAIGANPMFRIAIAAPESGNVHPTVTIAKGSSALI